MGLLGARSRRSERPDGRKEEHGGTKGRKDFARLVVLIPKVSLFGASKNPEHIQVPTESCGSFCYSVGSHLVASYLQQTWLPVEHGFLTGFLDEQRRAIHVTMIRWISFCRPTQ